VISFATHSLGCFVVIYGYFLRTIYLDELLVVSSFLSALEWVRTGFGGKTGVQLWVMNHCFLTAFGRLY